MSMPGLDAAVVKRRIERKDYASLEAELADAAPCDVAAAWSGFSALEKLIVFKLLDAPRAMELFGRLAFAEKYLVFCGFPPQSIAPAIEGLSPQERRPFVQLPREDYDRMFRQLLAESAAPSA